MEQYQHADQVDCLMQPLPVFTSKLAHYAVGRSRCKSRQTEQRHETKCQAVSVNNFARDFTPVEIQVKSIKGEMGGGIGKGTYPDHPTHIKKSVKAQDSAQRPHRERDEQEYECPIAGAVDQISDRPRVELIPNPIDQNPWAHWRSPMDMMRQG